MLAEQVREWTEGWVAEGREQGVAEGREQGVAEGREQGMAEGRAEERALLCRQAARKFDDATARRLAAALAEVADPDRLAQVGDWIIECGTAADCPWPPADGPTGGASHSLARVDGPRSGN